MSRRPARSPVSVRRGPRFTGPRSRRPVVLALLGVIAVGVGAWWVFPEDPARLRARAEAASRAGAWSEALTLWRAVNRTRAATGRTELAEARAAFALNRAAEAERALRLAVAAGPSDPEPWHLWLQLLRVEDRALEALQRGEEARASVPPMARRALVRDQTLAVLADLPDDVARATLDAWIAADPDDLEALAARSRRSAEMPLPGDPDRVSRIATLSDRLQRHPDSLTVREVLISALADAGETDRGRAVLNGWPTSARDARYWRLRGRWDLDYDHQPARAVEAFERALSDLPHDWRTHYRLSRALQVVGRSEEARRAALTVGRLRETLDPATLGPRLSAAMSRLDEPESCRALADLCGRAGLTNLADAWRAEAEAPRVPSL